MKSLSTFSVPLPRGRRSDRFRERCRVPSPAVRETAPVPGNPPAASLEISCETATATNVCSWIDPPCVGSLARGRGLGNRVADAESATVRLKNACRSIPPSRRARPVTTSRFVSRLLRRLTRHRRCRRTTRRAPAGHPQTSRGAVGRRCGDREAIDAPWWRASTRPSAAAGRGVIAWGPASSLTSICRYRRSRRSSGCRICLTSSRSREHGIPTPPMLWWPWTTPVQTSPLHHDGRSAAEAVEGSAYPVHQRRTGRHRRVRRSAGQGRGSCARTSARWPTTHPSETTRPHRTSCSSPGR